MSMDTSNLSTPSSSIIPLQKMMDRADCRKLAWNYRIQAFNGRICAEKEINIWIRKGTHWKRIHHIRHELKCIIRTPEDKNPSNPSDYVYVDNKGIIQFTGGYLEIEDIGLLEPLKNTDIDLGDEAMASTFWLNCSEQPNYYDPMTQKVLNRIETGVDDNDHDDTSNNPDPAGKNIHLEVEFESFRQSTEELIQSESGPYKNMLFHPIFYLPQNSDDLNQGQEKYGQVYFGEWIQGDEHIPYWGIANKTGSIVYPYELRGLHQLIISQDAVRKEKITNVKEPYFEFFTDSIGLKESKKLSPIKEDYYFGKGTRVFYVGYAPKEPAYVHEDSAIQFEKIFEGGIRRIFFDPNSSCSTCH